MSGSKVESNQIGQGIDSDRLNQRLADASIIAGRMAHDFDNILTGILGFADLVIPQLPQDSQAANFVKEIAKVGARGTEFTKQLHLLNRGGQAKPQPGNVSLALENEVNRLRKSLPAGVSIVEQVAKDLPRVAMESAPLQAVFGHLLDNASEAIATKGTIRISAQAVDAAGVDAREYLGRVLPGPQVAVTIQDDGAGIAPNVRPKLFAEPFFTTKVRHRGLGLAIVFRILYAHHGGVRIDAATPSGTTVRVILPPVSARAAVTV